MKPLSRALLPLAFLASILPAQASWSDVWDDAKSLAAKASEAAKSSLQDAWDSWDLNEELQELFGEDVDENSALVGCFYDLKQPLADAEPLPKGVKLHHSLRPASPRDTVQIMHDFMENDWNAAILQRFYSPKVRLFAPYFYLPRCRAEYGPKAFQCQPQDGVRPSRWVVLYRGLVKAPKSGKFRFVGMGDDTLAVRFNGKTVLEYGWAIPSRNDMELGTRASYWDEIIKRKDSPAALYQYKGTPHWNQKISGIASGQVFEVQEGKRYPIEILISEAPGSEFGFALLIEEMTEKSKSGFLHGENEPLLQIFRTNNALPERARIEEVMQKDGNYMIGDFELPPFRRDSLVWKACTMEDEDKNFFQRLFGRQKLKGESTAMGKQDKADENKALKGGDKGSSDAQTMDSRQGSDAEDDTAEPKKPESRREKKRRERKERKERPKH